MSSGNSIVLCADDFAMSEAISDAILSLAEAGRLSATGAIVTTPHWQTQASSVISLRSQLAVGLHLNLTYGKPLGPLCDVLPDGVFPSLSALSRLAIFNHTARSQIATEIELQLDRFEAETAFPPDFIDGHHHVHVFPVIRQILLDTLRNRFQGGALLLRDPSDSPVRIFMRRVARWKALAVATLCAGFRQAALKSGFITNSGFSGFSTFGAIPFEQEFNSFMLYPGKLHMIMCHPGLKDKNAELKRLDTIARRRPEEYTYLLNQSDLPNLIWRPCRARSATYSCWPISKN